MGICKQHYKSGDNQQANKQTHLVRHPGKRRGAVKVRIVRRRQLIPWISFPEARAAGIRSVHRPHRIATFVCFHRHGLVPLPRRSNKQRLQQTLNNTNRIVNKLNLIMKQKGDFLPMLQKERQIAQLSTTDKLTSCFFSSSITITRELRALMARMSSPRKTGSLGRPALRNGAKSFSIRV